jgi:hypothetical protein
LGVLGAEATTRKAVAAALEEALYAATRLQMHPLARTLLDFVQQHMQTPPDGKALLQGVLSEILTSRVLKLVDRSLMVQLFVDGIASKTKEAVAKNLAAMGMTDRVEEVVFGVL